MSTLRQRSKLDKKHCNLYNILHTWSNVVGEHLRTFMNENISTNIQVLPNEHVATKKLEQLKNITAFTNEQFTKMKSKYTFGMTANPSMIGCIVWIAPGGGLRYYPSSYIR